ncbi:hypothetical protein EVG20_g1035, partial [Dentipellis fragilis]
MVEPFLTSLNSIISTPVSAARPTKSHPAFRFALRSVAQPMHYHELASSRAKRYKGKEKALPENDWLQCAEWLLGGNCRSRLFATHHPLYAAASPSHTPLPQAFSSSAHNFASASKPAVVQHAEPRGPPPKSIISHFIYDKPFTEGTRVGLDTAYDAFMLLRRQNDPWTQSTKNTLRFVDRALSTMEDSLDCFKDRDALRYWSERLRALLSEGGSVASRSEEEFRRHCLLIRTFAVVHDLPRAMTGFRKFEELSERYAGIKDVRFRMYRSLLLAHFHLYGVRGVLDFLAKEWTTAGQPLVGLTNSDSMNSRIKSFIDTTFSILDEIESPISVLFDRRDRDPTVRTRIGHILISWLLSRRCPEEALSVWESMERQSLDCDLYVQMLIVRSLLRNKARELGLMSYSRASQSFEGDTEDKRQRAFLKTGLHVTCHLGDVNRAEIYFKEIQEREFVDAMDIAMLMHAYAVSANAERVVEIFQEQFPDAPAASDGHTPTVYHYTEVLLAYARARDIENMNAWLEKMKSLGQPPDAYVWNVILHSFAERGELQSALKLLDEMRDLGLYLNPADYTSVIGVFSNRKDPLSAEAIYERAMQEGVKPDRRMIATLMRAHALAGSWRGVVRAFDYLKTSRVRQHRPQIDVYNILLKSYIHLGAPFTITLKVLSNKGADINMQDHYLGTALIAASYRGHTSLANILLDKGADINMQDHHYGGALIAASYEGYISLVQLLLDKGTNINAQSCHYGTALTAASLQGHTSLVQLLLEKGADINAEAGNYGTALIAASLKGYISLVKILLDKGADINAQVDDYGAALIAACASYKDPASLAEMLLEKGADINAQCGKYGTALVAASYGKHASLVQLLFEKGADINAQVNGHGTALIAASDKGDISIVKVLLEKGADINAQFGHHGPPLIAASLKGHTLLAQFLLEKGADVNAQSDYYGTALVIASLHDHISLVGVLLEQGADINAQAKFYGTALPAASDIGHTPVVQIPLEKGNAQTDRHGTALMAALFGGHISLVEILLEKGADINAQAGDYGTALTALLYWGCHSSLVEFLLVKGADINAQAVYYGTVLIAASSGGHTSLVEFLLKKDA